MESLSEENIRLRETISQLELELAYMKGQLEVVYRQEKTLEKMEKMADELYVYTPLLEYISKAASSVYRILPAPVRYALPAPEDNYAGTTSSP